MKKVSIILPVYNREKTIKKTIESVLRQTYKNFELIIVDDGSKDNSCSICKMYQDSDDRIILIQKENGGPSNARNVAIEKATGDVLMFIDSDDEYKENTVEIMVNEYVKNNSKMVVCSYNNKLNLHSFIELDLEQSIVLLQENSLFNILWNKIYDLNIIKNNNIKFNENIERGEDLRFNIEYTEYINKITYINQSLYIYLVQNDSLTQKQRKDDFELSISNLEYCISSYKKRNFSISDYLKSQYIINAKNSIFVIYKIYDNKNFIITEYKKIINFLETKNVLKTNILKEKFKLKGIENRIIKFLLKLKIYNFIYFYAKIRNKLKYYIKNK